MQLLTIGVLTLGVAASACERTAATADSLVPATTRATTTTPAPTPDARLDSTTTGVATAGQTAADTPIGREVTLPAGTALPVMLDTGIGSDTSRVEQIVHAHVAHPVVVHGQTVLAEGARLSGVVVDLTRSGKVKGLAHVGVRFDTLIPRAEGTRYRIQTATVGRTAKSTKRKDALEIAGPAAGGAVIGALIGGKKGAAIGAAAGGGAGTAAVLSTRGQEVHLAKGTALTLRLSQPVTIRIKG